MPWLAICWRSWEVAGRAYVGCEAAVTVGVTDMPATVRLLTTSLTPLTRAASSAATERAVSSLTLPESETTPAWTATWTGCWLIE